MLAGSGVSIELIPAQETATSIVSAGVRITFQQTFPTFGPTTVRLVLGQVSATADPGQVIGTAATTSAPVVPVQDPGTVVGGTPTIGSVGLPSLAAPTVAPAASVTRVAERTVVHPVAADLTGLYPILLVGGALAVLGSRAGPWRRRLRRTTPGGGPA